MIICICCNLNTEYITNVVKQEQIEKAKDVHPYCQNMVKCGKCLTQIDEIIKNNNENV